MCVCVRACECVCLCVFYSRSHYTICPERYRGGILSVIVVQKPGSRTFHKFTVNYRKVRVTDPPRYLSGESLWDSRKVGTGCNGRDLHIHICTHTHTQRDTNKCTHTVTHIHTYRVMTSWFPEKREQDCRWSGSADTHT